MRLRELVLGLCLAGVTAAVVAAAPAACRAAEGAAPLEILADTLWEGTVDVRSPVVVAPGATLLLLPGTTVRFHPPAAGGERAGFLVLGALVAQGTSAQPIVLTSAAAAPAPGDWNGIVFERARERASALKHCRVEYAQEALRGAAAAVTAERVELRRNAVGVGAGREFALALLDADVRENGTGIVCNQGSSLLVQGSRIRDNREAGISCVSGSSPRILGCEVTGNGKVGISCVMGSSPLIEGNLVSGHERGMYVELKSRPRIVRNDIVANGTGIWAEKLVFPLVSRNLIARNGQGVYCNFSGYPELQGNNIVDNERFGLVLGDNQSIHVERKIPYRDQGQHFDRAPEAQFPPPKTQKFTPFTASQDGLVDARGNWWGEAATAQMAAVGAEGNAAAIEDVHDKPDTFYLGAAYPRDRAVFAPWETAPLADAGRPAPKPSGVAGKVILGGEPAAGVRVFAYPDAARAFAGAGSVDSGPSQPDGTFSLPLPPGSWYLVAKRPTPPFPHREPGEGDLFGYYGGNPVTLGEGERREVNLQVVRRGAIGRSTGGPPDHAVLKGTVRGPKGPLAGASVFLYPDAARNFRGPDLFGPQGAVAGGTDAAGRFEADVPPGRYFVVAVKHAGGEALGPLRAGDLHGWFDGNPVELAGGETVTVAVQAVEKLKELAQPAAGAARTGIGGTIRDPAGSVPAGVYAYATTDPNLVIGAMPPHRSAPVGPDGAYAIELPGPGTYYVGARSGFGGPPLPGQWHGFHGKDGPAPVPVPAEGFVRGIDVTVRKME